LVRKIITSNILHRELLPDKTQFLGLLETLARADETVVREQVCYKRFMTEI